MKFLTVLMIIGLSGVALAQSAFKMIPLGVKGGNDESNLSSYLVAAGESDDYICLDAGTIYAGLEKAIANNLFSGEVSTVLKNNIKGYLISHAHLDHIAGLILNSVDDNAKNIYGLQATLDIVQKHYFNWKSWPNFASEGESPQLKKYNYLSLKPGESSNIRNTSMMVSAFPLGHSSPYQSTAFLIQDKSNYILYLGDTGPDEVENSHQLMTLWKKVAPLIKKKQLKAIFIEVSFPNETPDKMLFGHLTPRWFFKEMDALSKWVGKDGLKGLNVIVTHMKPSGKDELIKKQLEEKNSLKVNFIFPTQGTLYRF